MQSCHAKLLTSSCDSATLCLMQDFLTSNGYPALFLLSFLASTLLPVGSEWLLVALLIKGFLPLPLVMVASVGNFLGACTTYALGIYGSRYIEEKIFRMDESDRERAERAFERFGSWSLLFTWLPVVGDPLCLAAGVLKVGFARFSLLVMVGKVIRYAVVAWATIEGKSLFV
jgi:membrane protein YqaA with SNARE-associated domain